MLHLVLECQISFEQMLFLSGTNIDNPVKDMKVKYFTFSGIKWLSRTKIINQFDNNGELKI